MHSFYTIVSVDINKEDYCSILDITNSTVDLPESEACIPISLITGRAPTEVIYHRSNDGTKVFRMKRVLMGPGLILWEGVII